MELENLNMGELCVHYKACRIKPCHAHCDEYLPKDDYDTNPEVDMLGYKSPIEVIMSDMVMKEEDQVMQAVWNVGVNVDKEELTRALAYDRDQYAAGYQYAKEKYDRQHGEWTSNGEDIEYICSVCGNVLPYSDEYDYQTDFCPNCGADMRKEGEKE